MWEHAYYLQYENRKTEWVESFWEIVHWADVAERFPYGIGVVSTLEARLATTLDDVTAFQRRVQSTAMNTKLSL